MSLNKKELNNEIILCRHAVRKAKVIVIRKIIKKMRILKSCKIETVREKKLKKCERLFKKVQIMKKLKDDDVTKFALRNNNLDSYLHGPKIQMKENALAHLAKHEAVARKVNAIREKIQNWQTDLPILLDSLGKKKKLGKNYGANKVTGKLELIKSQENILRKSIREKYGAKKVTKEIGEKKKSGAESVKIKKPEVCKTEPLEKPDIRTSKKPKDSDKYEKVKSKPKNNNPVIGASLSSEKPKKVDDPFFIDKKVIQPKLLVEDVSVRESNKEMEKLKRRNDTSVLKEKPSKIMKESVPFRALKPKSELPVEDQLHPSWAAKKVKLIKPFEGKKIVFSEE